MSETTTETVIEAPVVEAPAVEAPMPLDVLFDHIRGPALEARFAAIEARLAKLEGRG